MAYILFEDSGDTYSYSIEALDGDDEKVKPVDMSPDGGIPLVATCYSQGRALEPEHMPTRIRIGGPKRKLGDVVRGFGSFLVPDRFRDILEELEPGVHQFFPIALEWKDGTSAGERYWFNPCHRLDSVDREATEVAFDGIWEFRPYKNERFCFSKKKLGNRHVWIDKFVPNDLIFVSDLFKNRLVEAGITGIDFDKHYEEVD